MKLRIFPTPATTAVALCGLILASAACRKVNGGGEKDAGPPPVIAPELSSNRLADLPGAVYRSQAESPIHWQPWTNATMDRAKAARRLVFCVIAMPRQPGFLKVLDALEANPATVDAINKSYVAVLVDGDASREIGILTADLCAEIQRPLQLPLFLWMTCEGNPVAWIPVPSFTEGVTELFNQSHEMVSQMWEDDQRKVLEEDSTGYVLKNSALDNANRRERFEKRKVSKLTSEQPAVDVLRAVRQLTTLYDSFSRSFDEAGGLFPSSSLELLATASVRPGLRPELRARCRETTGYLLEDLLPSAMFDPLDGGVFSARRGKSWTLPSFARDCPGQAKVAVSLLAAHHATGNPRALDAALGLIAFAEKSYATPEGLFSVGLSGEPEPGKWMWSMEDVETALGPEDAPWWIDATRMKGLGNLPSEVDPQREFFRENSLGLTKTMAEIAAGLSLTADGFRPRFEAARAKLLAIRNERLGEQPRDVSPHADSTFRMVSAYAAAFVATGDEAYREKAVSLLTRGREAFSSGPHLREFSVETPPSIGAGRAFLYALVLQSALDVASITSDEKWLVWSEDLATTAAETFTGNGFLKECPDEAKVIDLPVTDLVMLFDDSTAGLVSMAEYRLAELGRPLVASFSELATPMPTYAIDRPILHTDLLLATLNRHYGVTVISGANLPEELAIAVNRLPMRAVQHRPAKPEENVPVGSVKVLLPGVDEGVVVSDGKSLREALLPSPSE